VISNQNYGPAFGDGSLTKARAKLVNRRALAERARQLGIGQIEEQGQAQYAEFRLLGTGAPKRFQPR
jgi:dsRNA-specific ribonuclease